MHGTWIRVQTHIKLSLSGSSSYKKFDTVENIKIGDGKYIQAIGSGDIDILVFNGKEWVRKYLSNVFHVPEVSTFFGGCSS